MIGNCHSLGPPTTAKGRRACEAANGARCSTRAIRTSTEISELLRTIWIILYGHTCLSMMMTPHLLQAYDVDSQGVLVLLVHQQMPTIVSAQTRIFSLKGMKCTREIIVNTPLLSARPFRAKPGGSM